tara:strand:- start:221 stop:322 length:102 start_codon:yes stop_codon:yes gene_type:complete
MRQSIEKDAKNPIYLKEPMPRIELGTSSLPKKI